MNAVQALTLVLLVVFSLTTISLSLHISKLKRQRQALSKLLGEIESQASCVYGLAIDYLQYVNSSGHLQNLTLIKKEPRAIVKLHNFAKDLTYQSAETVERIAKMIVEVERW